jgi:hypothetical protein
LGWEHDDLALDLVGFFLQSFCDYVREIDAAVWNKEESTFNYPQPKTRLLGMARQLRSLHDRDLQQFKSFLQVSGLGLRKAYYLVSIEPI